MKAHYGSPKVRTLAAGATAVLCAAAYAGNASAQAGDASKFPSRPIRMIVPFPPGGSNDILGRFLAQKMSEKLGQQTIVDNRPGADGIIGTELVVRAPADGYTLLVISTTYTMNRPFISCRTIPSSRCAGRHDASGGNVIATNPSLPVHSLKELIALAKAKPVRSATRRPASAASITSAASFSTTWPASSSCISLQGGRPGNAGRHERPGRSDVRHVDSGAAHIRSGKLKPLGVGSAKRSPLLPKVPTISEGGVPGYDGSIWWGVLGPVGIPPAIVSKLNTEIGAILRDPEMANGWRGKRREPAIETPEGFAKLIANDIGKWSRIAKQAGIRAD
jgi:tripartite-type tricarboxylate transporter receptor subunit TctC